MKTLTLYYAVNKNGQGVIFFDLPFRDVQRGKWIGLVSFSLMAIFYRMENFGFALPDKTWEDEPVELKLSLSYGK